ncbi:MAG: hypothetical protein FIA92_08600 [Chloroflexi bacterium]|nr:hypothetical protein [Chloroflexota bacterium]
MISVWINGEQRDGIDEGWIIRRVQGLRRDGETVCVRVTAKGDGVDIAVTAGSCGSGTGGVRQPNSREARLFQLWDACGANSAADFPPGQLIQCVKRLERSL